MDIDPISEDQRELYYRETGEEHPQPREPEILPANREVIWIWEKVENQVIQLQSGHILGVNIQSVMELCRHLEITGEKLNSVLEKIKFLENIGAYTWLKRIKENKNNSDH